MLSPSIVVIGAGPAGSTAARLLADHGARVTLLEARRLPRDKTCAGGVTPKARLGLPDGAFDGSERAIRRFEFQGGRLPPLRLEEPTAEIVMVERSSFDYALAGAAAASGAEVRDGEPAEHVTELRHGVIVRTRRSTIRADYLIAADGFPSRAARGLGLGLIPRRQSLALAARVPLSASLPSDVITVSFTLERGYVWYFPHGDHASVGAGSAGSSNGEKQTITSTRVALAAFAERAGLDLAGARFSGHWVPQGICRGAIASSRSILIGDAAGTVSYTHLTLPTTSP